MKTIFENVTRMVPVIRVNNRDLNLAFYTETLGLKVISEENALAILGAKTAKTTDDARLILEESPSMRTRAVVGNKKLRKLVIASPEFTEGFEATSPEGDLFEIVPASKTDKSDDVTLLDVQLNTRNVKDSLAFYVEGFELTEKNDTVKLPFGKISYFASSGEDLTANPDGVWDLEILEFRVPESIDLATVSDQLDALGLDYYVDKKGKILTVKDVQNLELWFVK
ncbi:CppA N-terminal domain-containing protein [Lactococcus insecticola]|uniref:Peptidase n=1 Tax=Pseudolactococcus insecticola TaxID=2709158 RepID=A0A6A0B9W5_9LACT|nr:CppA N-terminal domain-containing protein [Lactococcus insecticola]GFH40607.1 peptidase [Lactococcus insecticola]